MGGNQKGFSAIGECGVGNLRRTDRRLLTATPLHLKGQKIADYMRRLGFEMTGRRCFDWSPPVGLTASPLFARSGPRGLYPED